MISFTIPQSWSIYTEVIFTLTSGGESDSCALTLTNNQSVFEVGDEDGKTATVDGKSISVSQLNQLLYDLGYLADYEQGQYSEATRDAFASFICDYNSIKESLSDLSFLTLSGRCEENNYINFTAKKEDVKAATLIQDFLRGILQSNTDLYNEIKNNPALATFVIGFAITSGVIITVGTSPMDAYIAAVLTQLGVIGVLTQIEDIKNKVALYFNETTSFKAGYVFGEVSKLVGLATVIGFASKGLTNINSTIQSIKQAKALNEQGYGELASAIYEQTSRVTSAVDETQAGLQKGLDGVLKTVSDIETGEIFQDFQRLWTEVTQEEIDLIKPNVLKLLNDIVGKMQDQGKLFKLFENDLEGPDTNVFRNNLIDKRFQARVQNLGRDIADTIAKGVSDKVDGNVTSLNKYYANEGLIILGDAVPQSTLPDRLSTFIKISDLKKYHLQGTDYEEAAYETIIDDIKSNILNPSKINGELTTSNGIKWWTDTSKIEELRASGILTKEYITGDNGLALGYDTLEPIETHIEIIISKDNIDFYTPVSSAGGKKFIPSPNNPNIYLGKTLGGLDELYSRGVPADATSGHVVDLNVVE